MTTLVLDSSALLERYTDGPNREFVNDTMTAAEHWCISELATVEIRLALHQATGHPALAADAWAAVRHDFDAMVRVPVDCRCLARATEIGAEFGLRVIDAVHLAAADRIPRPARYATLDHHQIPAALALGLEVLSPEAS